MWKESPSRLPYFEEQTRQFWWKIYVRTPRGAEGRSDTVGVRRHSNEMNTPLHRSQYRFIEILDDISATKLARPTGSSIIIGLWICFAIWQKSRKEKLKIIFIFTVLSLKTRFSSMERLWSSKCFILRNRKTQLIFSHDIQKKCEVFDRIY